MRLSGEPYLALRVVARNPGVEKLAADLGISVNQLKNYAYDSSKSATLENFLHVLIKYRCDDILGVIAKEMGCCVTKLPESRPANPPTDAAADALAETARAVAALMERNRSRDDVRRGIQTAIEKLVYLDTTV